MTWKLNLTCLIEFNMFNLIFYEPYNLLLIITKP